MVSIAGDAVNRNTALTLTVKAVLPTLIALCSISSDRNTLG
jgi:hypothetical protein